jgi:cytochrome c
MKKLVLTLACAISFSALYAATPVVGTSPVANQVRTDDPVDLNQYAGKYKFEGLPFEYLTIGVKDGQLTINTGTEEGTLTPIKDTTDKFDAAGRATLKFNRDENKKVTGITLDAQGMSFEGKKEA